MPIALVFKGSSRSRPQILTSLEKKFKYFKIIFLCIKNLKYKVKQYTEDIPLFLTRYSIDFKIPKNLQALK